MVRSVTSQNDAAPKHSETSTFDCIGSVTSQNDAAPKLVLHADRDGQDQLPVKTTLHQNLVTQINTCQTISYQSKRRCTKTADVRLRRGVRISYQSKRRCTKTCDISGVRGVWISYQSKRRCTKTCTPRLPIRIRSVTSQNDAAPKLVCKLLMHRFGSVTSQNDAAPKRASPDVVIRHDQLPVKTTLHQNHRAR